MMNKINYNDIPSVENERLQCLAMDRSCANESDLADDIPMQLLSGGSIDYAYYDNKARAIRSCSVHGFVWRLLRVVVRVMKK